MKQVHVIFRFDVSTARSSIQMVLSHRGKAEAVLAGFRHLNDDPGIVYCLETHDVQE